MFEYSHPWYESSYNISILYNPLLLQDGKHYFTDTAEKKNFNKEMHPMLDG